jgi:hypothetical protein
LKTTIAGTGMLRMPLVITRVRGEHLLLTTPERHRIVIEAESARVEGDGPVRRSSMPRTIGVLSGELEGRRR